MCKCISKMEKDLIGKEYHKKKSEKRHWFLLLFSLLGKLRQPLILN